MTVEIEVEGTGTQLEKAIRNTQYKITDLDRRISEIEVLKIERSELQKVLSKLEAPDAVPTPP